MLRDQHPTNGTAPPATPPTAAAPEALLLTAAEAARRLSVSPRTLWGLTDRGEVPAVRIGRAVRYDPRDLAAYVDHLRSQARQAVQDGPAAATDRTDTNDPSA
jgi:excisionase family DNA binding protein